MLIRSIIRGRQLSVCRARIRAAYLVLVRKRCLPALFTKILTSIEDVEKDLLYVLFRAFHEGRKISQPFAVLLKSKVIEYAKRDICSRSEIENALETDRNPAQWHDIKKIMEMMPVENRLEQLLFNAPAP